MLERVADRRIGLGPLVAVLAIVLGLGVAACGKRGPLEPPAEKPSQYPKTYPTQ